MTELEKLQEKMIQQALEKVMAEINANIWGDAPPSEPDPDNLTPLDE